MRHELRQAWRERVLAVLGVVLPLLLAGASLVSAARQTSEAGQRARFQEIVGAQFRDQPDRHPHRVAHYGFLVFRPAPPLGAFDTGVDSYTGSTIFLEAHRQNSANFSDAAQSDGLRRFGELTPAVVLQLFVPLLVLAIAGVSVTREREAGTLWLLLCQGAPWKTLLWGKFGGALLAVAVFLTPGLLLTLAALARREGVPLDGDALARGALMTTSHVAYLAACAALAILVSASHRTSRSALVTLLGIWIALWVVLPRALPGLATAMYPVPTRTALDAAVERQVRELGDSHNPTDPRFQQLRADTLNRFGAARLDDLPINYNGLVMLEGEQLTSEAYRQHMGALLETYERQARLVAWAGFISPFVAMRTVSMALAGADVAHTTNFEHQAEAYRYAMVQHLNTLHSEQVSYVRDRYEGVGDHQAPSRQRISRDHWAHVPTFQYQRPTVVQAISAQPFGLLALAWWGAALWAGVWWMGGRRVAL
jgi:ABC-2 type transport system permease protein